MSSIRFWSNRRARWTVAGALALAVTAGIVARRTLGKPAMAPLHVPIERGDVVTNVEATGTVDAVTTVNVGAQVSGTITGIHVDFNSPVKQGQLLAVIDDSRFRAAFKQAEADMTSARAEVQIAETGLDVARAEIQTARANLARALALERKAQFDFERYEQLYAANVAAEADRDKLKSERDGARAAVASSQALVEQAQASLETAQAQQAQAWALEKERAGALEAARANLSYTVIRSPIDGIVVARNVDTGQTVAARLSAPNLFNIAQDLEHMYVYTKLDVLDVSRIKEGLRATFTVDAYPNRQWEGRVAQVRIAPITQLRGLASPSQLPQQQQPSIPGLQTQSGSSSGPAGSSGGPSGMGPSVGGSGSAQTSGGGGQSAPGATQAPGLVNYDALVEFSNPDRRLLPGMTAYVTFPVSAAYNVLRVRKEALKASPSIPEEEKRALLQKAGLSPSQEKIWIVDGSSYKPVAVQTGTTDYLFAEITSGAVREGQMVLAGYRPREK